MEETLSDMNIRHEQREEGLRLRECRKTNAMAEKNKIYVKWQTRAKSVLVIRFLE